MMDGGKGQVNVALEVLQSLNIDIPVCGLVKDDKHQTRALMDENRKELKLSEKLMNTITMFQDTVHDTAIGYHKKLRDAAITKSELDEITGIGTMKKTSLLKNFGSVEKIKEADVEEIAKVKGINLELAKKIKDKLVNGDETNK